VKEMSEAERLVLRKQADKLWEQAKAEQRRGNEIAAQLLKEAATDLHYQARK